MSDYNTENEAAIAVGRESANIDGRISDLKHPDSDAVGIPVVLETTSDGATSVNVAGEALGILDSRMPGPRRRTGTTKLSEVLSLIHYVPRYKSDDTVIYADTARMGLVVVFNEHPAGPAQDQNKGTGWRDHLAVYDCPRSAEWLAWCEFDGKAMKQDAFADFLEARLEDITKGEGYPLPLEVLQMARQLNIQTKGEFRREINPTNGDAIMVCKNETTTGSTVIPRAFQIAIPVFDGGARYVVEARVRFQLRDGVPSFLYVMHRRKEIERDAFGEIRETVHHATALLVLAGSP